MTILLLKTDIEALYVFGLSPPTNSIGGTIERFAIDPTTHALSKEPIQKLVFTGHSVNPSRQTKPFIHDVQYTPDYTHLVAVDLGTDELRRFQVGKDGQLIDLPTVKLPAGCKFT